MFPYTKIEVEKAGFCFQPPLSLLLLTTRMGFEPTTSAVTGRRSNQLSHQAKIIQIEWTFRDLNPGPIGYEPIALTS